MAELRLEIEKILAALRQEIEEAEAEQARAAEDLIRLVSGIAAPDLEAVRVAADAYIAAAGHGKTLERARRRLQSALM